MTGCNIERELERRFAGTYRRIWVAYTRLNSLQVVLFPARPHSAYEIITRPRMNNLWTKDSEGNRIIDVDLVERVIREGYIAL